MLEISNNESVGKRVRLEDLKSFKQLDQGNNNNRLKRWLLILLCIFIAILFLPWTQNIDSKGVVTSLNPEQRPQTIHSIIGGRIDKWFVKEGDFVKKGDTIIYITEIKDEYFDPNLLENVDQQIKSKESSVNSYMEKVKALDSQIDALIANKSVKLQQADNKLKQAYLKIKSDSIEYEAAKNNLIVAQEQLVRFEELYKKDLVSKTEFETRKVALQNANAKSIDYENKLLISRNEVINARAELSSIENDFRDKIGKAESDKFASLSSMYDAEATVTKLQNQYVNYDMRSGLYYVTAPQDGYITQAIQTGIGETIKEGEAIISIMPFKYDLAVEMFVDPMDLPLINKGQHVRFIFDGWPAFVFSGWPNASYGTFGGKVFAIDNFISPNGKYRMLVVPESNETWPSGIRVGTGANALALLNDVPIWYELWRKFNGFPPDFYTLQDATSSKNEEKK